jgi:hypothetical protein
MATNEWYVEDALNEVVRAIQDGSLLSITGLEDGYKQRYRRDFQDHWEKNDYSWLKARETILPLAELVGSLATMLSIYRAAKNGKPPRTVDQYSAYMAGYLVAFGVGPTPCRPGVWCMHYYYLEPDPAPQPNLDQVAEDFGKTLGKIETYLRPDQSTGDPQ